MDSHDDDDDDDLELEAPELAAALRRRAHELTGPLDTDAALVDMLARARVRRRWRIVASVGAAAAAAIIGVLIVAALGQGGDEVLRGAATPPVPATTLPTETSVPPTSSPVTPTSSPVTPPSSSPPATAPASIAPVVVPPATTAPVASTPSVAPTAPPTGSSFVAPPTVAPTTPTTSAPAPPSTTSYHGVGGSISVRLVEGRIALDGDPIPTAGWSVRIDDDGPDRVRVRFENGGNRSEVRIDLVNGVLVPRITES